MADELPFGQQTGIEPNLSNRHVDAQLRSRQPLRWIEPSQAVLEGQPGRDGVIGSDGNDGADGVDGRDATAFCTGTGLFLTLYRDGDPECLEIPTTGSFLITVADGVADVLEAPASGEYVLTSTDGVMAWEAITDCP